jgi:type IV secretion system protein VirD4
LNKSDNERSGVLSTAMSFLGLYRNPVVAQVTSRCDWRIRDLVEDSRPATLYRVVPPSDVSRTKPLVRLILNQIGRRLTEELHAKDRRHRPLLTHEFPALGRLDFFESALAFMADYGVKSFDRPVAQSDREGLGPNNSILDNCHVRVCFATNDERTAKRVSDALGTATELRAMEELCRPSAVALARPPDGLSPGDGAFASHPRRDHAASTTMSSSRCQAAIQSVRMLL